jgi:hypothetical protein
MGKGMNGIMGKALVWGGGIATALFAGFKAGKQLDQMFGLSDKIGGFFAKRFGVQEDEGLKAQLEQLRAARKEREAAALEEIENQKRITRAVIAGLDAQNDALDKAAVERADRAREDNVRKNQWEAEAQRAGVKQGFIGRILGRGDQDMQGEADRQMKMALDDDFRKQEKNAEKAVARAEARKAKLLGMGANANAKRLREQGRMEWIDVNGDNMPDVEVVKKGVDPRLRRLQIAEALENLNLKNKANLAQLQERAAKAAIDAAADAAKTAANTKRIKELQEQIFKG